MPMRCVRMCRGMWVHQVSAPAHVQGQVWVCGCSVFLPVGMGRVRCGCAGRLCLVCAYMQAEVRVHGCIVHSVGLHALLPVSRLYIRSLFGSLHHDVSIHAPCCTLQQSAFSADSLGASLVHPSVPCRAPFPVQKPRVDCMLCHTSLHTYIT
jgi:hypothetical protein